MRRCAGRPRDEEALEGVAEEDEAAPAPALSISRANVAPPAAPATAARPEARKLDLARLEAALQDLIACRQLLDGAMKEG